MIALWLRKALFFLIIAFCLAPVVPGVPVLVSAPVALVAGFLFTVLFEHPFQHLTGKISSLLLKVSVVGLGFGMNAYTAIKVGMDAIWLTIGSIGLIMVAGHFLGKWLQLSQKSAYLLSSGTAICGGSAIAAVAPAVGADERDTSVSLGVVFMLNSVALLLFPVLGRWFDLSQYQFGLWSAIAIHDTSSVVGASSAYGVEALQVATTVKLARALWIIPLSIVSAFLFKRKDRSVSLPWFIGLFVIVMLLNTFVPSLDVIAPFLFSSSKLLLVVTLFIIGSSLSIAKIKAVGFRPLLLGIILWIMISVLSLVAILMLY